MAPCRTRDSAKLTLGNSLAGQTRDRPSRPTPYKPLKLAIAPLLAGDGDASMIVAAFNLARDGVSLAGRKQYPPLGGGETLA